MDVADAVRVAHHVLVMYKAYTIRLTERILDAQEREADLERVAAEAVAASEAAEAQHSAEEQRLIQERQQLEAKSAQVTKKCTCNRCICWRPLLPCTCCAKVPLFWHEWSV